MAAKLRRHFAAGSEALIEALAALLAQLGREQPVAEARSVFAELLGALSIARIESDAARSDEILASSRTAIKHRLGLDRPA